jgi:hypothetical protein
MKKNVFLLCMAMTVSSSALAEDWYVDGGLGFINFDDGFDTLSPTNIYVRGGYIINANFNVGIEANVTVSPDQLPGIPVDFSVDMGTLYVRAGAPVSDSVRIYAQIGSTNTTVTGEYAGLSVSTDDSDLMMGVGAEIDLGSGSTYLAINYSIYNNNDGVDVTGFNIGAGARF